MKNLRLGCIAVMVVALSLLPLPAVAQDHGGGHGGGGGGGGGCGDAFGDLVHIQRHAVTGQPILAQRWIELPAEVPGYGWGYCPIAVFTLDGEVHEIPFVPYTCDFDPAYLDLVEEVDYFGRLNGGRTKERNHRMHLDEVISNVKAADLLKTDPAGRLMMGFDCQMTRAREPQPIPLTCDWVTVDSPMQSMALYTRLMKYGHLATDPYEVDTWAHGDPKLSTQFHPALAVDDWDKFKGGLEHLLPGNGADPEYCWDEGFAEWYDDENQNGIWDPAEPFIDIDKDGEFDAGPPRPEPFTDLNGSKAWDPAEPFNDANDNGVADEFMFLCAEPEPLQNADFLSAAAFVGGAANKTGFGTVDLFQYLNRILKITKKTQHTAATVETLPALYRDCWESATDPADPPEGVEFPDPAYLPVGRCAIREASPSVPNWDYFPDVQELFVDFSGLDEFDRQFEEVEVIMGDENSGWFVEDVSLMRWVRFVNGKKPAAGNIAAFVDAGNDAIRAIEFIHNYAIPVDLYCVYDSGCSP